MPITFYNSTPLDIRALITLGVNIKESDSPIGFFGTGFKFAVATLLRHNCGISILSEGVRWTFKSSPTLIRGKPFNIILLEGPDGPRELGFTTDLGKNWELWMAYRELYCNAKDEGGDVTTNPHFRMRLDEPLLRPFDPYASISDVVTIGPPRTQIIVSGSAFEAIHSNRKEFLFLETPDVETPWADVVFKPASAIFYRGIKVADASTFYTYNIKGQIALTEDRTAKYTYELEGSLWLALEDLPFDRILPAITSQDSFEGKMNCGYPSSDNFWLACEEAIRHNLSALNPNVHRYYLNHHRNRAAEKIEEFELTAIQRQAFEKALAFVKFLGFPADDYPILFARRLGEGVLGAARQGKIYIAEASFERGTKIVAGTLIEEFLHLRENVEDATRGFQDYLLNRIVTLGERLKGEAL